MAKDAGIGWIKDHRYIRLLADAPRECHCGCSGLSLTYGMGMSDSGSAHYLGRASSNLEDGSQIKTHLKISLIPCLRRVKFLLWSLRGQPLLLHWLKLGLKVM